MVKSIINELNFLNQNWVLYAFQMAFEDDEILYSMYKKGVVEVNELIKCLFDVSTPKLYGRKQRLTY